MPTVEAVTIQEEKCFNNFLMLFVSYKYQLAVFGTNLLFLS